MKQLKESFFRKDAVALAKDLLGNYLVHESPKGRIAGKIVETESYLEKDPASHSYRGRSKRNNSMFMKGGTSYVYFTYGMYHCFNISANRENIGEAVLIRSLEPVEGIDIMKRNRKIDDIRNLCNGPAKLVMALGISKDHDGIDMSSERSPIKVIKITNGIGKKDIVETERIGISKGKNSPYRFYIKNSLFVSKK